MKKVAQDLEEPLTDDEIREMIEIADTDGDGEVNLSEFLDLMKKAKLF